MNKTTGNKDGFKFIDLNDKWEKILAHKYKWSRTKQNDCGGYAVNLEGFEKFI